MSSNAAWPVVASEPLATIWPLSLIAFGQKPLGLVVAASIHYWNGPGSQPVHPHAQIDLSCTADIADCSLSRPMHRATD